MRIQALPNLRYPCGKLYTKAGAGLFFATHFCLLSHIKFCSVGRISKMSLRLSIASLLCCLFLTLVYGQTCPNSTCEASRVPLN